MLKEKGCLSLLTALLLLLCQAASAENTITPLDYSDLPEAHRVRFEAEIEDAIAKAASRLPGEEQLFATARGVSNGYEDSTSGNGISFKYSVNESIIKVGEQIRFTVSGVTSGSSPLVYSVAGLLFDENFNNVRRFSEYQESYDGTSWAGRSFTYTPTEAGYISFVFLVSNSNGKNAVAVTTNTIQVYADEKPLFRNMAVNNDLAAILSLDAAKTRVGDVITATAMFSTKTAPVKYTATWTLYGADEKPLDTYISTGQLEMKGQVETVHFDYWPLQAGQAQFELTATDGDGNAVRINTPGLQVEDGFAFRASLDKKAVSLGESLKGTYQISGHVCDSVKCIVGWTCYDAEDADMVLYTVSSIVDSRAGESTFTPRFGERIEFSVRAVCDHYPDLYPAFESATLLYGLDVRMSLTAAKVKSGESIGLNFSVSDGQDPYQRIQITGYSCDQDTNRTYQFFQQTVSEAEGKVTGKPYLGDLVYFEIKVTEKDGFVSTWRSDMIPLTDAPTVSAPALAAAVDAEMLELGESITLTYQMTGGSASISKEDTGGSYAAWKKADGTIVATDPLTSTFDTITFTPKEAGEYICILQLTDAYGQRVSWTSDSIYVGLVKIPGDADDDGAVNLADAQRVLEHCAGGSVTINAMNADVNSDGQVDIQDALLLLQFAAGWNVRLQ